MRGALLTARRDAPALLQPVDQPLHPVALRICSRVRGRVAAVAGTLVSPVRDHGTNPAPREESARRRVAVPAVAYEPYGPHARPPTPGPPHLPAREERLDVPRLVALAAREDDRERLPAAFGADVYLGGESAPAATECLVLLAADGSGCVLVRPHYGAVHVVHRPVQAARRVRRAL
jgi:hypothetical protein